MQILSPNKLQKKKLKEMISSLLPKYKYVQISKDGIISLRKNIWWYLLLISKKVNITDMCLVYLPEQLAKLDPTTETFINKYSQVGLGLMHLRNNSVIDYLYDNYVDLKLRLKRNHYIENSLLPVGNKYLLTVTDIVPSVFSNIYAREKLKQWKDAVNKLTHPVLFRNYINLWFKKEVKETLNWIDNIQLNLRLSY